MNILTSTNGLSVLDTLSTSLIDIYRFLLSGVDRVISVDLQRPGQGHEACFFDNNVPLEAIVSTDHMVDYFVKHVNLQEPIVVVTPNNECVKKARNFQLRLQGVISLDDLPYFLPHT